MSGHRISRLFLKVGDTEIQAPTVEEAKALAEISQTVPKRHKVKVGSASRDGYGDKSEEKAAWWALGIGGIGSCIWAIKNPKSKYTFNYEAMKALNEDVQMRSTWEIPICTGKERLKDKNGHKLHPTQKPEALLYRVIMASTKVGDVILDPFFGTGTTGAVAKKLGRFFIGIEKDPVYVEGAQKRIDEIEEGKVSDLEYTVKKKQPRVPFGSVVEQGFLKPGTVLYDSSRKHQVVIRADGTVKSSDAEGSIHQLGAAAQNASACNGWTYWYYEDEKKNLVSIDEIREKIRQDMEMI